MPDTKISALPAVSTLADADVLAIINGGLNAKVSLSQLTAYFEQRGRQHNASVANQGPGFAADTYLVGSDVLIPAGRLQAKSIYRCQFQLSKTAAGTATPIFQVRFGTAGTTADTSRLSFTFGAGTAAVDEALVEIFVTFRAVGAGATTVLQGVAIIEHRLSTTGFINAGSNQIVTNTSAAFDSTSANSRIGVSVNGGTSAAWTSTLVQAELRNLA